MIGAWKLHIFCPGDVLGQIPTRSDRNKFIARPVKYQGGRLNGRQHMSHIEFVTGPGLPIDPGPD